MADLPIQLDRARRTPLAAQIYSAIREGIENGRLASGARLPFWRDLAAQLGVSRGTVRSFTPLDGRPCFVIWERWHQTG
jgi:GntR family transcriptional regulator/MocR family aminotransferase